MAYRLTSAVRMPIFAVGFNAETIYQENVKQ